MRRAGWLAVAAVSIAMLAAACPGRNRGTAEPAKVHIDWPDAAPHAD